MAQDKGFCAPGFLKYVLFIFNIIFLMAGIAVAGVGIWTVISKQHFLSLLVTSTYIATANILIVAGVLIVIVTCVGCVGILKEHRCMLLIYTFSLLVIFLLEAVAGILAYVYLEMIEMELNNSLNSTFVSSYSFDKDKTTAIDDLQRTFKCCGAVNELDWKYSNWQKENSGIVNLVPDSCCRSESAKCGYEYHPSNVYITGCTNALSLFLRTHLITIGAVALGFSLIQIFGMIFSCCLYRRIRYSRYK